MFAFHNPADAVDQPNDARMQFRTKAHVKDAIQRAAALAGVDDSAFMVSAVYQSALATIAAHEQSALTAVDHAAFFTALDKPDEPTLALQAAFESHQRRVASS